MDKPKRQIDTKLVMDCQKYAGARIHYISNRLQVYYILVDNQSERIDECERELRAFVHAQKNRNTHPKGR